MTSIRILLCFLVLFAWTTTALSADVERLTAWVSEENCKEQHSKPGGKDCVKKCLRGGAHVGEKVILSAKLNESTKSLCKRVRIFDPPIDDQCNALETLFHEASHAWDPWLIEKLKRLQIEKKQPVPERFWHTMIFYTAGEITRRALEDAGIRNYIPYAELNELYERGRHEERCALERRWKAHLNNKSSDPEEAYRNLVRELINCKSS